MSKAIVFDTETTGSKQPMHIVEAAYIVLDDELQIADTFQGLFNPEMPIALGAKALFDNEWSLFVAGQNG